MNTEIVAQPTAELHLSFIHPFLSGLPAHIHIYGFSDYSTPLLWFVEELANDEIPEVLWLHDPDAYCDLSDLRTIGHLLVLVGCLDARL